MTAGPDRGAMEVLGEAVARSRRDRLADAVAISHEPAGRLVDYRRFCTTAWKTGNFLRNEGVRAGTEVVVADEPSPRAVTAFYGAALLGATVSFGTGAVTERTRALVGPTATVVDRGTGPGTRVVAYGTEPADPGVAYFERDVWSENPTEPPDRVRPDDDLLEGSDRPATHRDVLTAAGRIVDRYDLGVGDVVAVRSSLAHPGAVAAGLVAPVVAGAVVLFPEEGAAETGSDTAAPGSASIDVAVVDHPAAADPAVADPAAADPDAVVAPADVFP